MAEICTWTLTLGRLRDYNYGTKWHYDNVDDNLVEMTTYIGYKIKTNFRIKDCEIVKFVTQIQKYAKPVFCRENPSPIVTKP